MKIIRLKEVDSTNEYLKRIHMDDSILVFCERQTNGHGQYQRSWYFEEKSSIAFSYKCYNPIEVCDSYVIALNFCRLINNYFGINAYIKRPNDIYLNNKKLCGVLIETSYCGDKLESVIIGVGLNINNEKFPAKLCEIATSIYKETKRKYSISEFENHLCKYFESDVVL